MKKTTLLKALFLTLALSSLTSCGQKDVKSKFIQSYQDDCIDSFNKGLKAADVNVRKAKHVTHTYCKCAAPLAYELVPPEKRNSEEQAAMYIYENKIDRQVQDKCMPADLKKELDDIVHRRK